MKLVALVSLLGLAGLAHADPAPGWNDVPALLASATAAADAELRACTKKLPVTIAITATRDSKTHATQVAMPIYGIGWRNFTAEERCLSAAIAKVSLPELPAGVERIMLGHTIAAAGAAAPATEKAFDDWRDPASAIATLIDAAHKKALAACSAKPRTTRLILDLRDGKTRVWLPAWQFHSGSGDGSTPRNEATIKACLTKAIASWKPPTLPHAMAELQLVVAPQR